MTHNSARVKLTDESNTTTATRYYTHHRKLDIEVFLTPHDVNLDVS